MADISLVQDVCMDDCDEGVYEQGDCSAGSPADDDALPPLLRVQKYALSGNVYDRQMVARIVQEIFQTASAEYLIAEIHNVMTVVMNLGEKDEAMVRADLLEQIPHMASQALEHSKRAEPLKGVIGEYLLPLVVRNLGCSDNAVDKAAHSTLIQLMEQGLITRLQAEIQVCPAILALSNEEQTAEINTGAITLMSRMAPLLGRDVTERVFLKKFSELCSSHMFYVRKVCASQIGDFCAVVGEEQFEKVLLPAYIKLCEDEIWGVRKASAEVVMFVSSVCPSDKRKTILAPAFSKLLQDDCRWVQASAFHRLGPFIATFATPPITSITYTYQGDLVFVNKDGDQFLINSPTVQDSRFFKPIPMQSLFRQNDASSYEGFLLSFKTDDVKAQSMITLENFIGGNEIANQTDEGIKQIVETVKNAFLSYRNPESEHGTVDNLNDAGDIKSGTYKTCDNLDSTFNKLGEQSSDSCPGPDVVDIGLASSSKKEEIVDNEGKVDVADKQVNSSNSESENDDDSLHLYNSHNYWYISPDIPLDPNILNEGRPSPVSLDKSDVVTAVLEEFFSTINLNDDAIEPSGDVLFSNNDDLIELRSTISAHKQDIVPQYLIEHYILMTNSSLSINVDSDILAYHCAYSLPAVALTLENNNWPLLQHTVERLAVNMQYKVRRILASSLHELARILGGEIATEHLTPIFEGFIKDLDEVRIGILRHLACFLKLISPEKRRSYLPRLQEFLKTENEWNWRFRYELAQQLLLIVTMFKPVDAAKHIGLIAEHLLYDVAAVRQVAITLISELVKHISTKPGLNSYFLARLVEKFAHSKKWKRRQTFALLCYKLLQSNVLPPEQFATELMPHLLDLSWDPVANVRLVVAKGIAQHIIPNEYFADPNNQHLDSLGTVIRRLQSDKDRDVRQHAEVFNQRPETPPAQDYVH